MLQALPSSLEIERLMLGAILVNSPGAAIALESLHSEDFSTEAHRRIFSAMRLASAAGIGVDRMTVIERLQADGNLEAAGGMTALAELDTGMPQVPHLESWKRILHEKAMLRRAAYIGEHAVNRVLAGNGSASEILADISQRLGEISTNGAGGRQMIQSAEDLMRSWEANYLNVPEIEWVIPGIVSRGTTTMFSGIAGCGKSSLLSALGWKYTCRGGRVLIVDLENEPATINDRFRRIGAVVGPDFLYWGRAMDSAPCMPGSKFVRDLILADSRPLLVIVDSFAAFGSAMDAEFNENDAGVVTRFFASFQDLAARDRGTFAVIHHNNREDEFRGSSAIPANIDTGYMVKNLDRAGGTKLDMMTLTPSIKTRRLSDRATFYYDNGAFNCDPGPLASARAENIALTTILRENPGITGKQFEKASAEAGISRDQARRFLQTGVEFDQIRREPGAHNSGRYYLKFSSPNQFAEAAN